MLERHVAQLVTYIGLEGRLACRNGQLRVNVRCVDARVTYGNIHVLVTPRDGVGETWCEAESIVWFPREKDAKVRR